MPGIWKLPRGIRNTRASGSPSGLNQTSAILSPRNVKAAHCFEGSCSEKFKPRPPSAGPPRPVNPGRIVTEQLREQVAPRDANGARATLLGQLGRYADE